MAKKLARREQVTPMPHTVTKWFSRLQSSWDRFVWNEVQRFPFRHLFGKTCGNLGTVIVFWPWSAVTTLPFVTPLFPCLSASFNAALKGDRK